jgi:predicted aspartyl protease
VLASSSSFGQELTNPYKILNRYFRTTGGLDRLLSEITTYSESTLSLGGMEGTLKAWTQAPNQNRVEIVLGPLSIVQGDNGEHSWTLDQNGKVQVVTNPDPATVARRKVRKLMNEYAFASPGSEVFKVTLQGIEQVEGKDCYAVKITNNVNVDSHTKYINTQTFLQEKVVFIEDDESRDAYYGDYREIDGLLVPFWTREVHHQTGQDQEMQLARYDSNPTISPEMFEPPQQASKDYRFLKGDRAEDVAFKFIENHLFVPVTVGGKKRLWVLDTGAGVTVLNKAYADELGLDLEGQIKGQGAGGTVEVSFATLPPFAIEGVEFDGQVVAVIDMSELLRRIGLDVAGILGFDFLSRFVTKVDFAKELVSFYDPETFEYSGEGQVLDMHLDQSVFRAQATLDGRHAGSWLFDLGAGTSHLDGRYALREGYADRKGILGLGHGAGNEYQLKSLKCDSLDFAGYTVYKPLISFAYGGTDTAFSADLIGTLGNTLFRNFVLHCDYANERLIIERGDKFNQSWPEDHSGLQLSYTEDREIKVLYVAPGTPAEVSGFVKGDVLRSIDGAGMGSFDGLIGVRELLRADPGTEYEFLVERDGQTHDLRLQLAELL